MATLDDKATTDTEVVSLLGATVFPHNQSHGKRFDFARFVPSGTTRATRGTLLGLSDFWTAFATLTLQTILQMDFLGLGDEKKTPAH